MSQMELAHSIDVSPRHVSLVETGKATPSPSMLLRLAAGLDVPLRNRNQLLLAAGYAPRYPEREIGAEELERAYQAVVDVLSAHEPYPALVIDRRWNIVLMNRALGPFLTGVAPGLLGPPANWVRLGLHPHGLAPRIVNLSQVRALLQARIARQLAAAPDPEVQALYDEFFGSLSGVEVAAAPIESEIAMPMIVTHGSHQLKLFSTITTFGTPQDVTLEEISIELYYPADRRTADLLRSSTLHDIQPQAGEGT